MKQAKNINNKHLTPFSRRGFLAGAGLAAAGTWMRAAGMAPARLFGKKRPNVIFVHGESWDGRVLGFLGNPALKNATPNCDNLAARRPDVVVRLDAELRAIADYPQVHKRVIEYDKAGFRNWREQIKVNPIHLREYGADIENATYDQVMANCYMGWSPEHAEKLERWLEETN